MKPRAYRSKTIILVGDGMADEPLPELGGRTPLQAAATPAMDALALAGRCGALLTLPEGFPTGSEVANMSILGCDLAREYCGRGPLEAAGRGVRLAANDIAYRLNLVSEENGILTDYSGGHIGERDAVELVQSLNNAFGTRDIRILPGVSYRNLLVLGGGSFSEKVRTEKPDDNQGERIEDHLPVAAAPEAKETASLLRRLMIEAPAVLSRHPVNARLAASGKPAANGVWPWSGGRAGALRPLAEKYGVSGAVISAVDVINGLGRCLGMEAIAVPGATGYVDTNYEGKADAAVKALAAYDLVYLHVEAIDEVSHEGNLDMKIKAIEDFDSRVVGRVLAAVGNDVCLAVLPDHPVPVRLRKHTRTPVPVAVRMPGAKPDSVRTYDEQSCLAGALGTMRGPELMRLLFPLPPA